LNRSGIVLERQIFAQNPGSRPKFIRASSSAANPNVVVHVVNNSHELVKGNLSRNFSTKFFTCFFFVVVIKNVYDDVKNPILTSEWTISLAKFSRTFNLSVDITVINDVNDTVSVRVVCYSKATSVTGRTCFFNFPFFGTTEPAGILTFCSGMFDRGIVQMMNNLFGYFPSNSTAKRIYGVGGGAGWDIINMIPEEGTI
jgi:hypothetical protein